MPTIKQNLGSVQRIEKDFIGTVALRNEKICLQDGSKVAIGMDDGRWVIVYQQAARTNFIIYEFNAEKQTVLVDKKVGGPQDVQRVKEIISYFFENAQVEDLVTIEPGGISN